MRRNNEENRPKSNRNSASSKRTTNTGSEASGSGVWKIRLNVCRSPSSDSDQAPSPPRTTSDRRPSAIALSVVDAVGYHRTVTPPSDSVTSATPMVVPPPPQSTTPTNNASHRLRITRNSALCPCLQQNDSDAEGSATSPTPSTNTLSVAWHSRASVPQSTTAISTTDNASLAVTGAAEPYPVHTQVEYTHFLVPDLLKITNAPYYWGIMDRFEAERVLENKPEGTFVLRDSAQSEYLFSVSFRRYQRTLHARIEQLNHKFSFDSYDPGVFSASSVTELIKHYEDPAKCLFFEPLLSRPLARNFPFPLQHLCRAAICDSISYNNIQHLELPKKFKDYLREYHYKQRVRVRQME